MKPEAKYQTPNSSFEKQIKMQKAVIEKWWISLKVTIFFGI